MSLLMSSCRGYTVNLPLPMLALELELDSSSSLNRLPTLPGRETIHALEQERDVMQVIGKAILRMKTSMLKLGHNWFSLLVPAVISLSSSLVLSSGPGP